MKKKGLLIIGGVVLVLVIAAGVIALYMFPATVANIFNYPNRQPLVKNPGDYGLEYEDVTIETEDGVTLAGWLMRGSGDDVVIIGHPVTFTKYGYSLENENAIGSGYDRDVEFIPTAKHLVEAGYSVLMYDTRNHGESGAIPNDAPYDPVKAYRDVVAVALYVSKHPELAGKDIGLLSFCQSSFIGMVAMSKAPEALKDAGVKAMVAVQPIATDVFYKNYGLPDFMIKRINRISAEAGVSAPELQNPVLYAGDVFVPVLFVQALGDPWSDIDHSRAIYDAIPTEKEAIWLEGDVHRFYAYNYFNDHPEKLLDFFEKYLGSPNS